MFSPPKSNFDIGSTSAIISPPPSSVAVVTASSNSSLNNCSSNNLPRPLSQQQQHPVEHHIDNNITESYKNRKNSLREVRNSRTDPASVQRRIGANDNSCASSGGKEQNMNHLRRNGDFHQSSGPGNGNNSDNNSACGSGGRASGSCSNMMLSGANLNHNHNNSSGNVNNNHPVATRGATYRVEANSAGDVECAPADVGNGASVGDVIVVTRTTHRARDRRHGQDRRRRRPSESEISSRTSHSFSTSSSSRYSGSGTPCHRGSSCSEAETSSTTSSETSSVEPELPYPGFPAISLKYLTQTTKPRNWCLQLITNPYPFAKPETRSQWNVCQKSRPAN